MRWWSDLWLNEGFATYSSYLGSNSTEPGWGLVSLAPRPSTPSRLWSNPTRVLAA